DTFHVGKPPFWRRTNAGAALDWFDADSGETDAGGVLQPFDSCGQRFAAATERQTNDAPFGEPSGKRFAEIAASSERQNAEFDAVIAVLKDDEAASPSAQYGCLDGDLDRLRTRQCKRRAGEMRRQIADQHFEK